MDSLPPYGRFLGIETRRCGEELLFVMPFSKLVIGRPGFLHGGAIAGLLELASFGEIRRALGDEKVDVKPINVTVSFMRGGGDHDTFAAASVSRIGQRVANVEAHAWQSDRSRPIASAQMNMLLRRTEA